MEYETPVCPFDGDALIDEGEKLACDTCFRKFKKADFPISIEY